MSNCSFTQKISDAFKKIPEKFYSHFPTMRKQYEKIHTLNATFTKIEQAAFASFPSLKECKDNPFLQQKREIAIREIQKTSIEGKTIEEWLKFGSEKLKKSHSKDLYLHERKQWDLFEQQLLGLHYRSGKTAKGTDIDQGAALFNKIEPIIQKYLASSSLFPGRHDPKKDKKLPDLTPQERSQLLHACTAYPLLIEKFLNLSVKNNKANDPWISSFVKWTLRSGCNIGVFVKTPQEKELLASIHLDKRSGAVDGKKGIHFKDVVIDGVSRKVVCLKIDDKMEPIQGEFKKRSITLKNLINPLADGMTLTIEKIFQTFKEKTRAYGDLDYLAGGVRNWNAIELGSLNQTTKRYDTVKADNILEELLTKAPLVSFSYEELQKRYRNCQELSDGQWAIALRGSRLKPNLNILQSHGYKDLIYRQGDRYFVFPMGIQPKEFPSTSLGKLLFFSSTSNAGLHYPDESFFLSQRDQIGLFFPLTSTEFARLRNQMKEVYLDSQTGKLVFQFAGDNCAFHIQKLFDKVIAGPFYDKLQSVLNQYLSSKNIISKQLLKNNSVRAFQGLNHGLLKKMLSYMVDDLWEKRDFANLRALTSLSTDLLTKIYAKPFDAIDLDRINFNKPDGKKEITEVLFQTIEVARFYRIDLFRTQTDQPFLKAIHKIIRIAPWRWLKNVIINTVLFIMGSWRWVVSPGKSHETILPHLPLKNLASNPLIQEGYLNHPASLWEWDLYKDERKAKTEKCIRNLNHLLKGV